MLTNNICKAHAVSTTANSGINQLDFVVRSIMNTLYTAIPVQVIAVEPPNYVDVLPLVKQLDNNGEAIEQTPVYQVPYTRIQGGENAVIIDPQKGDIGICIFAMRDITGVKVAKGANVPQSLRTYDSADGMYIGGLLNGEPKRYVEITDEGVRIEGAANVTIHGDNTVLNASNVTISAVETNITGNASISGTLTVSGLASLSGGVSTAGAAVAAGSVMATGDVTAGIISLAMHKHSYDGNKPTTTPIP